MVYFIKNLLIIISSFINLNLAKFIYINLLPDRGAEKIGFDINELLKIRKSFFKNLLVTFGVVIFVLVIGILSKKIFFKNNNNLEWILSISFFLLSYLLDHNKPSLSANTNGNYFFKTIKLLIFIIASLFAILALFT